MLQASEKPENRLTPAVAPALWPGVEDWQNTPLQRYFALARQQLPNLKIFTVFADQLGHWPLPPSGSYEHMAALSAREDTLDAQLWSAHSVHLEQFLYEKAFVTSIRRSKSSAMPGDMLRVCAGLVKLLIAVCSCWPACAMPQQKRG